MAPLFSIITVTYNAASTLPATLRSVREQTCGLYEHIVMDGASTDGTLDIAREDADSRCRVYSSPDNGLYDAMNKAMAEARGEYLIFLNAGDRFHSADTLQLVADAVLAQGNDFPGIVYGQTDLVDMSGHHVGARHLTAPETLSLNSFADGMVVCHQAFIALHKVTGEYDLRYRYSADYEWCIRCLQRSRNNLYIPHVLIDYLYEGLTTRNRYSSLRERFAIMCRYYGTLPTIVRHIRFIPRFLRQRMIERRRVAKGRD
ncbi:MAG: glycosyltransferase [Pseudoflavonifractor sp.]|nr:glycosyltransferase [Pseudoflavonifractor sp.]